MNNQTNSVEKSKSTPPSGGRGAVIGSDIELRSEEVQEVLGNVPGWILRRGITLLALIVVMLIVGSWFFKYPEIISSQLTLTTANPPANIIARTSGKISELFVDDLENVRAGSPLALIENPAALTDVLCVDTILQQISQSVDNVIIPVICTQ